MMATALLLRFPPGSTPEDRDRASALLLDFETAAVHEQSDLEWRIYFRTAGERARAAEYLRERFHVVPLDEEAEDWARKSQESLRAITIGGIVVAPPWDVPADRGPERRQRDRLIIIEPSTGFGTGHHATTRLCLLALQRLDLQGKRVLDVGTGSGVLALAAVRLGASAVTALDSDVEALANARANAGRNLVTVDWRLADLEADPLPNAEVVIANLTGATLRKHAATLATAARPGVLIVSGVLWEEEATVRAAFRPIVEDIETWSEDGWIALTMRVP